MELYQQLYHLLFNAATDAIRALERNNSSQAKSLLIFAQKQGKQYISIIQKMNKITTTPSVPRNDIVRRDCA